MTIDVAGQQIRPRNLVLGILICGFFACAENRSVTFPRVTLKINPDSIPDEGKVSCRIQFEEGSERNSMKAGIEYRGSASRKFPKRSYSIHIRSKKVRTPRFAGYSLQGDWVLYGPYADRSLIRNTLGHKLFREMGHYSPRSVFTELYLDTAYWGLYEWRERIELSADRVAGATHIIKVDKSTAQRRPEMRSSLNKLIPIRLHDSLPNVRAEAAFERVFQFEKALSREEPDLRSYIDLKAWVDYFLITEWANSPDAYRSSAYMQVLEDGRLRMGPVWDFDLAFGNSTLFEAQRVEGWRFMFNEADSFKSLAAPPWWRLLYQRKDFRKALCQRWHDLRQTIFSDQTVGKSIDGLAASIAGVSEKNFSIWPVMDRSILWTVDAATTYTGEIDRIKQWLILRGRWMDEALRDTHH